MYYELSSFHHCSIKPKLQGMNDIMNLANTLAGNFMGVVQYNTDYPVRQHYHFATVAKLCSCR